MRIAVIGSGPAGLVLGSALARRGHDVTAVDRDPGPPLGTTWARRGVMQFHHAHAFRSTVVESLERQLPEAVPVWLATGAEPITVDTGRSPGPDRVPLASRAVRARAARGRRRDQGTHAPPRPRGVGARGGGPGGRRGRRRVAGRGRPRRRRLGPGRPGHPPPRTAGGQRGTLRAGVRRPRLPPPTRRRTRPDVQPGGLAVRARRLPRAGLPARPGLLLHAGRPPGRRPGAARSARQRRVRRGRARRSPAWRTGRIRSEPCR